MYSSHIPRVSCVTTQTSVLVEWNEFVGRKTTCHCLIG